MNQPGYLIGHERFSQIVQDKECEKWLKINKNKNTSKKIFIVLQKESNNAIIDFRKEWA